MTLKGCNEGWYVPMSGHICEEAVLLTACYACVSAWVASAQKSAIYVISSNLRWAVLTVLWIGFCLTGPISVHTFICVYVFVFCFFSYRIYMSYYCNAVLWIWWDWSWILSSFSVVTLLVGFFDPYRPVPDMTYNVFRGMLYFTQPSTCMWRLYAQTPWLMNSDHRKN